MIFSRQFFISLCLSSFFLVTISTPVHLDPRVTANKAGKVAAKAPPKKVPAITGKTPVTKVNISPSKALSKGKVAVCKAKGKVSHNPAKKSKREWKDYVPRALSKRAPIVIGYHGTNCANADEYIRQTKENRGLGTPSQFNGADSELGKGLYITDGVTTAKFFASGSVESAKQRGDKRPRALEGCVCKLDMQDSNWIRMIDKAWIPSTHIARLRKIKGKSVNDPKVLQSQEDMIKALGQHPEKTVRFSKFRDNANADNQAMIPPGTLIHITMRSCDPVSEFVADPDLIEYGNLKDTWRIKEPAVCE